MRQELKTKRFTCLPSSCAHCADRQRMRHRQALNPKRLPKVFVGLSGGVDSSVSAALLKKAGFDVHGVFIKTWSPDWLPCSWKEERLDAMRVAAHLDIPFYTLDLEKEYKKEVADYMIAEYRLGRTPNPDVMCNKHVKFGGFYDWAMKNGGKFVATGHYARIEQSSIRELTIFNSKFLKNEKLGNYLKIQNSKIKNYRLLAGFDSNKDQSYFLWNIRQDQLSHILFPVGQYTKSEVRLLAKNFGLPTADKKDSQGLCFMGKIDVKDFLSHYIKSKPGKVFSESGEEIGFHNGALFLTVGERHGFTITKKTPNDSPYYIWEKDIVKNEIMVGHEKIRKNLPVTEIIVKDVNWINRPRIGEKISARIRYRQPLQRVRIMNYELANKQGKLGVTFEEPQIVAAGQSAVIYRGEECLGGGIIV